METLCCQPGLLPGGRKAVTTRLSLPDNWKIQERPVTVEQPLSVYVHRRSPDWYNTSVIEVITLTWPLEGHAHFGSISGWHTTDVMLMRTQAAEVEFYSGFIYTSSFSWMTGERSQLHPGSTLVLQIKALHCFVPTGNNMNKGKEMKKGKTNLKLIVWGWWWTFNIYSVLIVPLIETARPHVSHVCHVCHVCRVRPAGRVPWEVLVTCRNLLQVGYLYPTSTFYLTFNYSWQKDVVENQVQVHCSSLISFHLAIILDWVHKQTEVVHVGGVYS